jgi:hypothetical protein
MKAKMASSRDGLKDLLARYCHIKISVIGRMTGQINQVINDDANCSVPVELAEVQNSLFF